MSATTPDRQEQAHRQALLSAAVAQYPPEDYEFQIGNYLAEYDQLPRYLIVSEYHDGDRWLYLTDEPSKLLEELEEGYDDHGWLPRFVVSLDDGRAYGVRMTLGQRFPERDVAPAPIAARL